MNQVQVKSLLGPKRFREFWETNVWSQDKGIGREPKETWKVHKVSKTVSFEIIKMGKLVKLI